MGIAIEEAIKRFQSNAEYERTHGNLQGCLEFRQLAEWLRKYQKIVQIMERTVDDGTSMYDTLQEIEEVIEDENHT